MSRSAGIGMDTEYRIYIHKSITVNISKPWIQRGRKWRDLKPNHIKGAFLSKHKTNTVPYQ